MAGAAIDPKAAIKAATESANTAAETAKDAAHEGMKAYKQDAAIIDKANDAYDDIRRKENKVAALPNGPEKIAAQNELNEVIAENGPKVTAAAAQSKNLEKLADDTAKAAADARAAQNAIDKARSDLKPALESAQNAAKAAKDVSDKAEAAKKAAQNKLDSATRDVDSTTEKLQQIGKTEAQQVKAKLDREASLLQNQAKLPGLDDAVGKATQALEQQDAAMKPLTDAIQSKNAEIANLKNDAAVAQEQAKRLAAELDALKPDTLEAELKKAQSVTSMFEAKMAQLEKEAAEAIKKHADAIVAQAQNAKKGLDPDEKCPSPASVPSDIAKLKESEVQAQKQLETIKKLVDQNRTKVQDAAARIEQAKQKAQELANLKEKVDKLNDAQKQAKAALDELNSKLKPANEQLQKLKNELGVANDNLKKAKTAISQTERKIEEGAKQLAQTQQQIDELKNSLKDLEDVKTKALDEFKKENALFNNASEKARQANDALNELKELDQKAVEAQEKAKEAADEAFHHAAASYEYVDGAHIVGRHGPDVSTLALTDRITTGKAPDGKFSPTKKSSKFSSYEALVTTRNAGKKQAAASSGLDFSKQPKPTDPTSATGIVNHGKTVAVGYEGQPPSTLVSNGKGLTGTGWTTVTGPNNQSGTKTEMKYDPYQDRWRVAQHISQ